MQIYKCIQSGSDWLCKDSKLNIQCPSQALYKHQCPSQAYQDQSEEDQSDPIWVRLVMQKITFNMSQINLTQSGSGWCKCLIRICYILQLCICTIYNFLELFA